MSDAYSQRSKQKYRQPIRALAAATQLEIPTGNG
jgi:hypothetical protein